MAKTTLKFRDSAAAYERLAADIRARRFAPLYLLMGEESYFIDALADLLAETILDPAERAFNQLTVYGRDTDGGQVVNLCRQMPMMGAWQVVIVREAQQLRGLEKLAHYTQNPSPTTILVICHKEKNAEFSVAVMEVPWEEAPRFGIMSVNGEDMITEFAEKPKEPKSNLASMGIYVFSWKALRQYLTDDEANPASENDFGKNIIPTMLGDGQRMAAYRFAGYWKDVGTLDSLWDANMDMLSPTSGLDLSDDSWPIYARSVNAPPAFLGGDSKVSHSAINRGSVLEGTVENSVLSSNVTVGAGARVSYSVLLPGTVVEPGAVVEYAILGEGCKIGPGCHVGGTPENTPEGWGLTVLAPGCKLPEGQNAKAGVMLNRNGEEVSK